MAITIRVELLDLEKPKIWRTIRIPDHYNFDQLHKVIQAAMGWKNAHYYLFSENGFRDIFTICSPRDDDAPINAKKVNIVNILLNLYNSGFMGDSRKKLKYIYDYGDDWEHEIDVFEVSPDEITKAELLDGAGACPPEDCGGEPGFIDLKNCLITGEPSEIHGEMWGPWLESCGYKDYDPDKFDLALAKARVRRVK